MREAVTVPVAPAAAPWDPSRGIDPRHGFDDAPDGNEESVIGRDDRFEGTLASERGIRVLGTFDGAIASARYVHLEEGSTVKADVTADEVIVAGDYSGKLVCRQRLEIRATGRVHGSIETVRLMLHEGGYIDGELHMQEPGVGSSEVGSPDARAGVDRGSDRSRLAASPRTGAGAHAAAEMRREGAATTSGASA
jgi:cytoskeletal protein CcmA (bactofilin family)